MACHFLIPIKILLIYTCQGHISIWNYKGEWPSYILYYDCTISFCHIHIVPSHG